MCRFCSWAGKTQNVLTRHERATHASDLLAEKPKAPASPADTVSSPSDAPEPPGRKRKRTVDVVMPPPPIPLRQTRVTRQAHHGSSATGPRLVASPKHGVLASDFVCVLCGRTCCTQLALTNHMKLQHTEQEECCFCGKKYPLSLMPKHKNTCKPKQAARHEKALATQATEGYECAICHEIKASRAVLRKHVKLCLGLSCPHCGKAYPSSAGVRLHVPTCPRNPKRARVEYDTAVKPFLCSCGTRYKSQKHLNEHQRNFGCSGGGWDVA